MPKARIDKEEIEKLIEDKVRERHADHLVRLILEVEHEMFEIEHPSPSSSGKGAFDKFTSTVTVHDKEIERKLLLGVLQQFGGSPGLTKLDEARRGRRA